MKGEKGSKTTSPLLACVTGSRVWHEVGAGLAVSPIRSYRQKYRLKYK